MIRYTIRKQLFIGRSYWVVQAIHQVGIADSLEEAKNFRDSIRLTACHVLPHSRHWTKGNHNFKGGLSCN